MNNPLVCAIMLTKDRPGRAARAVASFRAQAYGSASLLIFDNGAMPDTHPEYHPSILYHHDSIGSRSIGTMRNDANSLAIIAKTPKEIDIFVHWDDDDYSHPSRIAEQVALLQSSGADCVGYRDMLFWRESSADLHIAAGDFIADRYRHIGEAWRFSNDRPCYALGTSLCYWRKIWERKPFKDLPQPGKWRGEDTEFIEGLKVESVSSLGACALSYVDPGADPRVNFAPRMIASIHGGNTAAYDPKESHSWKRVPEWDEYCRERMKL